MRLQQVGEGGKGLTFTLRQDNREKEGGVDKSTEGQVNVKVPAPRDALGECSAYQGTAGDSNGTGNRDQAEQHEAFWGWREGGIKREGRDQKSRGAEAGNGTAGNESQRVGCGAADGRADEKDEHGSTVDPAYRVTRTQLAKQELRHTDSHQVDTAIPSDVLERMKLIQDIRDGSGHDCVVLGRGER